MVKIRIIGADSPERFREVDRVLRTSVIYLYKQDHDPGLFLDFSTQERARPIVALLNQIQGITATIVRQQKAMTNGSF